MKPLDPRLIRYARSSGVFLVFATALGLVRTACTIAFCLLLAHGVTDAVAGKPLGATIAELVLVVLARAASIWAMDAAAATGAARVKSELRHRLVGAVAHLGPGWLARHNRAEIATTAVVGLESLDGYFALFIPQLVLTVVATPVIVAVMYHEDILSGIIVTATLPLVPLFMILIGWATQTAQQKQWSTLTHLSSRFLDAVNGLATLKIFGRERRQEKRLAAITEEYRHSTMKVLRLSFLSGFALELIATLSVALVAVSIGLRLVDGSLGLEVGLFVLLLAPEAFLPLRQVGANYHAAADGVAAATAVFAILDEESVAGEALEPERLPLQQAAIRFDDVCVSIDGRPVVSHFSASALPGKLTVLDGASGSGKSTIFAAMLGFAPFTGTITRGDGAIDRGMIAWSSQHNSIVSGTVCDNVALGDPAPDRRLVLKSLALAAAIEIDPGLLLDDQGEGLSGGQAERVGIARAIYRTLTKGCPLLVLDEPSAALDAETEARLILGIRQLARDGTTVIIASHRTAVIQAADAVISTREVVGAY
jgi:ATP-binding cassette subfamily C protein CydD